MYRLTAAHGDVAFAFPYVAGVAADPVELPDGSTVDDAGDRRAEVPEDIRVWFGVHEDGKPTILGRYFLKITGAFKLADIEPVEVPSETAVVSPGSATDASLSEATGTE